MPIFVHITDVQRFKECRRKWDYASPLKRNLVPTERYAPYYFGTLVHYVLEQVAKGYPFSRALHSFFEINEGKVPMGPVDAGYADFELAKGIFRHYVMWQKTLVQGALADEDFEHISPEHSFTYPLYKSKQQVYLKGKFDGIVKHKATGKYFLWEIKTTRSVTERMKQLDLEQQTDAYLIAAQYVLQKQLGIDAPVEGMVYTLIRKKVPTAPAVLKNGQLSQAKQDVTPYWYAAAAKQQHPDLTPSELGSIYGPILSQLQAEHTPYFARHIVQRTPRHLTRSLRDLIAVTKDMLSKRTALYPNPTPSCNFCLYRDPCVLMQAGTTHTAEALLKANYKFNSDFEGESLDG